MSASINPRYIPPPPQQSDESGQLTLRDGTVAQLRPAHPADLGALTRFFRELSAESRYRRFLSASMPGPDLIARLASESNPRSAVTLVATRSSTEGTRIVATGSYIARDARTAEVALAVADEFRGKGLVLLR